MIQATHGLMIKRPDHVDGDADAVDDAVLFDFHP